MAQEPRNQPLDAAAAALARRDRSAAGLATYLEQRGIDPDAAADAVEHLSRAGYIDDARFAAARAEQLADRGWGDEAIRHDLERQGSASEATDGALATLEPESVRAFRLLGRYGRTDATARKLAAKGFSQDSIETALGSRSADADDPL